ILQWMPGMYRASRQAGNRVRALEQFTLQNECAARYCGRSVARNQDSDEIHGIGACNCDFALRALMLRATQTLDHFRKSELLSSKSADESTPADLSAIFKTAQHAQQY